MKKKNDNDHFKKQYFIINGYWDRKSEIERIRSSVTR